MLTKKQYMKTLEEQLRTKEDEEETAIERSPEFKQFDKEYDIQDLAIDKVEKEREEAFDIVGEQERKEIIIVEQKFEKIRKQVSAEYNKKQHQLEKLRDKAHEQKMKLYKYDSEKREKTVENFGKEWDEMLLIFHEAKQMEAKIALLTKYDLYR